MSRPFTHAELEAFLDESLAHADMAQIETAVRQNPDLIRQLAAIHARRDSGIHSVGEIWRRFRVSCPDREQLGGYLLGVLDTETHDYIRFHLDTIGCRLCAANLEDLQRRQSDAKDAAVRRRRYFQSSVGYISRREA